VPKRRKFFSPGLKRDLSYISSREGTRTGVQSSHYLVGIIILASQGESERRCIVKARRTGRYLLELQYMKSTTLFQSVLFPRMILAKDVMASIVCPSRRRGKKLAADSPSSPRLYPISRCHTPAVSHRTPKFRVTSSEPCLEISKGLIGFETIAILLIHPSEVLQEQRGTERNKEKTLWGRILNGEGRSRSRHRRPGGLCHSKRKWKNSDWLRVNPGRPVRRLTPNALKAERTFDSTASFFPASSTFPSWSRRPATMPYAKGK
jgi:hypothetical protein